MAVLKGLLPITPLLWLELTPCLPLVRFVPLPSQALKVRAVDSVLAVFVGVALTNCTRVLASANNSRADVADTTLDLLQFAPLSVL